MVFPLAIMVTMERDSEVLLNHRQWVSGYMSSSDVNSNAYAFGCSTSLDPVLNSILVISSKQFRQLMRILGRISLSEDKSNISSHVSLMADTHIRSLASQEHSSWIFLRWLE
ncbi:hypothetical protein Drorol1_Dr00019365 [Drosera rotundifolia]